MQPVLITAHEKHFSVKFDENRTKTFDYRRRGNGIEAAVLEIGLALTQRRFHDGTNTQVTISDGGADVAHLASSNTHAIRDALKVSFASRRASRHIKHVAAHANKLVADAAKHAAAHRDPYAATAAKLFNKPASSVTTEERKIGKSEVFGRGYSMQTEAKPADATKPTTQQLQQHERQMLGSKKTKAGKR